MRLTLAFARVHAVIHEKPPPPRRPRQHDPPVQALGGFCSAARIERARHAAADTLSRSRRASPGRRADDRSEGRPLAASDGAINDASVECHGAAGHRQGDRQSLRGERHARDHLPLASRRPSAQHARTRRQEHPHWRGLQPDRGSGPFVTGQPQASVTDSVISDNLTSDNGLDGITLRAVKTATPCTATSPRNGRDGVYRGRQPLWATQGSPLSHAGEHLGSTRGTPAADGLRSHGAPGARPRLRPANAGVCDGQCEAPARRPGQERRSWRPARTLRVKAGAV